MFPRARALQAFTPTFRSAHISASKPRFLQFQRRTYAEKAAVGGAPVSGQPRDWTSRLPLFILVGIAAYLPVYYLSHATKPSASAVTERLESRRTGDPSQEFRDVRDSPVKTLEQKKARDGVDHRSEKTKAAEQ